MGKTYLRYEQRLPLKSARINANNHSSLVIDTLCDHVEAGYTAVACFYSDSHPPYELSPTELLGALFKQAVGPLEPVPEEIQTAFEKSKRGVGARKLRLPDLLEVMAKSLVCLRTVFLCIDALDEFPADHRQVLWESLKRIVGMCPNVRLFVTGNSETRSEGAKYFPTTTRWLKLSPSVSDIISYLEMRLGQDPKPNAMNEWFRADILRTLPEVVSGTYVFS